ncbi:BTB/POZ domain-containing protein 1-like [Amblyomma americanum]
MEGHQETTSSFRLRSRANRVGPYWRNGANRGYGSRSDVSTQTEEQREFSLARFLESEEMADVEIIVNCAHFPNQRKSYKAHRIILGLQNKIFRAMLSGGFRGVDRIIITDLHPEGVHALLRYFYNGQLEVETLHQALYTRSAATKYLVPELEEMCIAYIKRNMKPQDVCPVFDYLFTMGEDHSDLPALDLLKEYSLTVLTSEAFARCSVRTANYVIECVADVPQISVFRALHRWAQEQRLRSPAAVDGKPEVRTLVKPFFPKLHFLALTAEEFVTGPNLWGILNDHEARAVLSNIVKKGSLPLPPGFSNYDYSSSEEK